MASKETNPVIKNQGIGSNVTDLPSNKLVSAKRANTGKLNLHLVSSTPMNPAKRAKFFDESILFRSPIKSGGSSSDVNSNSPDNKKKNLETDKNIKNTMLNEEQAEGEYPFPFVTKLSVKKMTICASDYDTETEDENVKNIIAGGKTSKKLQLDSDEDFDLNLPGSPIKTKAIEEPTRKVTSNKAINSEVEKNVTKNVHIKLADVMANKNVLKTTRANLSDDDDDDKENENTDTNEMKTKPKSELANKNTKKKQTDIIKPNLDISPKQRKADKNTEQKKRMTKTKIENDSNMKASDTVSNKKSTLTNDTKIKSTKTSMISPSALRKSSRSCASTVPYWMAPWDGSVIDVAPSTRSEEIASNTIKSVKDTNRTKSVPEAVTKKKEPKRNVIKLDSTVTLNRSKTKSESEQNKKNNKKESNEANAKNITINSPKRRMKKPEPEKIDIIKESIEENEKNVALNTTNKIKKRKYEKKSTAIDEVSETPKKLNKSKIKESKEPQRTVLKSNKNDQDTRVEETKSNVQENKKRQYPKEILDKENKEKKNKAGNITAKRKSPSPTKSTSKTLLHQTVMENEVFEPEIQDIDDDLLRTLVAESFGQSKNNSKREDVKKSSVETLEILSPPRTSKRISEKTKKHTKKHNSTPEIALKPNKNDVKTTVKKKASSTENKVENRTLRSKTSNRKQSHSYVDGLGDNVLQSEDLFNSESSNDIQQRRMIDPVKTRTKSSAQTPGLVNKRTFKMKNQYNHKSSKQVNFNVNDSESISIETDSLSSHEIPSRMSCKATYNAPRQFSRSRDSRYPRRTLFYKHDSVDGPRRRSSRKSRYQNDSTLEDSDDDSWSSEENYVPRTKRRKYTSRKSHKKRKVAGFLNFKENALEVQVPAVQTLTQIQQRGRTFMMECFGFFPTSMTKINAQSSSRGTCFMNEWFASGMMEITVRTVKKCNASNNHTYFLVLDGMAEIGIADSVKIMRIGDCCIVPKHTFYYIANVSSEVNLLLNFLKISL